MSYQKKRQASVITIVTLLVALLGVVVFWSGYQWLCAVQRQERFVPTTALVTDSKTALHHRGTGGLSSLEPETYWGTDISFTYRGPDGTTRTHAVRLTDGSKHPQWGDEQTWDTGHWRRGQQFEIFVNPTNADEWTDSRAGSADAFVALVSGFLMAVGGGALFYRAVRQQLVLTATDASPEYYPGDDPISMQVSEGRPHSWNG